MSGRTTAIEVDPTDPFTWYVGLATGGIWKTINNGVTFEPIFDRYGSSSIGSLAVAPSNPQVLYAGTGENNPRNSVTYGDGIYRSADGGKTWTNVGLRDSYQIGRVVVHPKNENVVYVAALGRLWGPNRERGLFKTTDGGKTWSNVLYLDDRTGAIDLVMDPKNPDTLYVAMWERMRDGFDSHSGKPEIPNGYDGYDPMVKWGAKAGIYKTTDGGKNFRRLTQGLPTSKMGRIGLSIYHKDPRVLFAVVDSEKIGTGLPQPLLTVGFATTEDAQGIQISQIVEKGPAEKAGLKSGDVLRTLDGQKLTDLKPLFAALRAKKVGETITIGIDRKGTKQEIKVTLELRPGVPPGAATIGQAIGASVENTAAGLVLTRIREGRAAQKAGIQDGDLILSVDGKAIKDSNELLAHLGDKKVNDKVLFKVKRGEETKDLELVLNESTAQTGAFANRPYTGDLAGQQANVQDAQGPEGDLTGGVYRSDNGGETWRRVNSLNPRPMYFSKVEVDPSDDRYVYILGVNQHRSSNGGRTFTADFGRRVHADGHALWINPADGRHMIIGTDGGWYMTYDRGDTWEHLNNYPLGQFYHVAFDFRKPYRVYGGLQDNGSWGGPSHTLEGEGPVNEDWINIGGGDGFVCRVDPFDPDIVYGESQGGFMYRRNLKTGSSRSIRPRRVEGKTYFFNWNTPFILSSHNPGIFYAAGNYVFKSIKRGDDLQEISPLLTRTTRGSATALSESPRDSNVLWAGTDDGYIWITRDGGAKWTNVTENLKLGMHRWVGTIEASRYVDGRAYVCLTAHRSDDDQAYLFVTEDFGATWKSLNGNLPKTTTRTLREDPVNPNLLYCGTEIGVFVSLDRGETWAKMDNKLPVVPVHELAIHPEARELIAGTHGRSVWICDVSALQGMNKSTIEGDAALYAPAPGTLWRSLPGRGAGSGHEKFYGENRRYGVTLWVSLKADAKKVELKVVDVMGRTVRDLEVPTKAGLHAIQWDLRGSARSGFGGSVRPGEYRATLIVDGKEYSVPVRVDSDPVLGDEPQVTEEFTEIIN